MKNIPDSLQTHFYTKRFCSHCDQPIDLEMLQEHLQEKHIDVLEGEIID